MAELPLIAILRGIEPDAAVPFAAALQSAGLLCVEVPLNSPLAHRSIEVMRSRFDGKLLIGAGTVRTVAHVSAAHSAGAQLIVSPNTNPAVIDAAKGYGLISIPGFLSPSEAFAAIAAGADALKLFPAEAAAPALIRALRAVMVETIPLIPVGGITPLNLRTWIDAGAAGAGIGSALYSPGCTVSQVYERAVSFVSTWRDCRP
jgi:2-dehydro-3-deoxyphosphogalactonate aldolase